VKAAAAGVVCPASTAAGKAGQILLHAGVIRENGLRSPESIIFPHPGQRLVAALGVELTGGVQRLAVTRWCSRIRRCPACATPTS
jgi:hypothetical protein